MPRKREPQPDASCTPEEMHWLEDDGYFYELEEGILVRYPSSPYSSMVRGNIISSLFAALDSAHDAWILSLGVGFQCFREKPNTVRRASVSYIERHRISVEDTKKEQHCRIAPDLVAEVLIRGDLPGGIHNRVTDWLAVGVRVVWVINPESRTFIIHHRDGPMIPLSESDCLTCEELLPGFSCRVGDLFQTMV